MRRKLQRTGGAAPAGTAAPVPVPDPVAEWSHPAPICEYKLVPPAGAQLHVERRTPDRPGLVLAIGAWLEAHGLSVDEFGYSPCPGAEAAVNLVASGACADVVAALASASGANCVFDQADATLALPEKRHTVRCTLYIPDDCVSQNLLIPVGEAAFRPNASACPGLPYANISHLVVERAPYAMGVPGYYVDAFFTADCTEVLDAVLERLESIREPLGSADSWVLRKWLCACPVCAGARGQSEPGSSAS